MADPSPLAPHSSSPQDLAARLRAARTGLPFLVLRDGAGEQQVVVLEPEPSRRVVGRRSSCDVPLPWDDQVSRAHAILDRLGEEWALSDDGVSSNGTWVAGGRVRSPRVLRDGDLITVGATTIAYVRPDASPTAIATRAAGAADVAVSPAQHAVLVELCRPLLQGAAGAASNREIADRLVLGMETVKTHVKALYGRFGLDDLPPGEKRAALGSAAVKLGVVTGRDIT